MPDSDVVQMPAFASFHTAEGSTPLSPTGVIRCRFIFSGKNDELTPDFRPRISDPGKIINDPEDG
ncbi:MAG: hypothetical protein WBX00_22295 [Isosphaeraceae bacterium]